jgi:WG containing repeat
VILLKYDRVWDFQSNGLAQVMKGNRRFFIDRRGQQVPDATGKSIFSEGLAVRYDPSGKRTNQIINAKRQIIFTLPSGLEFHPEKPRFTSGLILVRNIEMDRYGYVDRQGKIVIPPKFSFALPFDQGLAEVSTDDDHAAYINTKGNIVWINTQSSARQVDIKPNN